MAKAPAPMADHVPTEKRDRSLPLDWPVAAGASVAGACVAGLCGWADEASAPAEDAVEGPAEVDATLFPLG
ncbi:hypothetical protein [Aliidongia dinghuensis]|uniref:hypothetical protein n=1 Tax=Aliidongia dinghuensis TaxID=1867774 RepID=UPI00166A5FC8|nr:hypothetical protein [Aliidongia dinghuensis]